MLNRLSIGYHIFFLVGSFSLTLSRLMRWSCVCPLLSVGFKWDSSTERCNLPTLIEIEKLEEIQLETHCSMYRNEYATQKENMRSNLRGKKNTLESNPNENGENQ